MKMGYRWMLGGLVLALLVPLAGVEAQEGRTTGLIIAADDPDTPGYSLNVYRWDEGAGQLERLNEEGPKRQIELSPDGNHLAYCITPPSVREVVMNGHSELADAVCDIEVFEMTTGVRLPVAGQPENMILDQARIRNGIDRAGLVWSPDGTMLAWTEQDYPATGEAARRVVRYDFAQGTTRVLDDDLPSLWMSDDGLPFQVAFGRSGIVVCTNRPDGEYPGILRWYDPQQGLLGTIEVGTLLGEPFNAEDRGEPPTAGPLWVQDGAAEILIIQLDGMWFQVDPQAGTMETCRHTGEPVSARQPDQSLRVVWVPTNDTNLDFQWEIWSPAGESLYSWGAVNFGANIVIAPTGDAVAFSPDVLSLAIWRTDGLTPVAPGSLKYLNLFWGPALWRVSSIVLPSGIG